jgi:hypothetical protein
VWLTSFAISYATVQLVLCCLPRRGQVGPNWTAQVSNLAHSQQNNPYCQAVNCGVLRYTVSVASHTVGSWV